MNRLLALLMLVASVVVAGIAASPAGAVKFGAPDTANQYPWVGLMVAYDEDGNPLWRCTGSLLSKDLFLTAATASVIRQPRVATRRPRPDLVHGG